MLLSFEDSQTTFHIDTKPLEIFCIIVTHKFIKFFNVDIDPKQSKDIGNSVPLNYDGFKTSSKIDTKPSRYTLDHHHTKVYQILQCRHHSKTIPETCQLTGHHQKMSELVLRLFLSNDNNKSKNMSTWAHKQAQQYKSEHSEWKTLNGSRVAD